MHELFDLSAKVALVTGGSSGIGRAIAQALSSAGAKVVVVARREQELNDAVHQIESEGGSAAALAVDLSERDQIAPLVDRAKAIFGPPDILVNSAGINLRQPVDEVSFETWDRTLWLNLSLPFFLSRAIVEGMRRNKWGRIINIASLQSCRAFANSAPYGASKGGIMQLTRAMAEAWSAEGINCNSIAPGFFPTELTAPVFANSATVDLLAQKTAIGRNGRLQDLAGIAIFLSSQASDYITGQTIFIDGGFTAK